MHSLKFTFYLALFLFVPFFLREISLEPYPAILLPDGGGVTVKKRDSINFAYMEIYGLDAENNWKRIDARNLLNPIPGEYINMIINILYYSSPEKSKRYKYLKKIHFLKTSNDPRSADRWFINKLEKQHMNPYTLRIVNFSAAVNLKTGNRSNKIVNEKIIRLHK
jgi:hypothetical protein